MKYVICDDEVIQIELLSKYIKEYAEKNNQKVEIVSYLDCNNLWWDLQNGVSANLLLLDIQMKHMSGIELARKMRKRQLFHMICFVSGVKEFVFEGYDLDAIGYILKPYEKDQIFRILDKANKLATQAEAFSFITTKKEVIKIYHNDVIALEAIGHDTQIYLKRHIKENILIIRQSIKDVMNMIHIPFVQPHRSYAVNMQNILKLTKTECIGEGNLKFPIARGNYEICMQAFIRENRREIE